MFHGVKKKDVKALTEEEKKKNEETLKKLKVIQDKILVIKKNIKNDEKTLDFLIKAAKLMPDYPTLWSMRKQIIELFLEQAPQENKLTFLKKETKQIFPLMKQNPKCYLLWYHRIWCLIKILEIEVANKIELKKCSLMDEINLCNVFLNSDDRNFHVWNYRVNILTLLHKFFSGESFQNFIIEELQFTLNKVKVNFSNFSAWHYRAKLIPIYFSHSKIHWNTQTALDYFKEDLNLLKNAFYTDPKDQSPWNYHSWIITNFSPIFIEKVEFEDKLVKIFYSNVFKIKNVVQIEGEGCTIENNEEFSDCLTLALDEQFKQVEIKNKEIESINMDFNNLTLVTNKICFTKENLSLPTIKLTKNNEGKIDYEIIMNNFEEFQKKFLLEQIEIITKLIEDSTGYFIENAHLRLAEINKIFYKCYKDNKNEDSEKYRQKEKEELLKCQEHSKRLTNLYSAMLANM